MLERKLNKVIIKIHLWWIDAQFRKLERDNDECVICITKNGMITSGQPRWKVCGTIEIPARHYVEKEVPNPDYESQVEKTAAKQLWKNPVRSILEYCNSNYMQSNRTIMEIMIRWYVASCQAENEYYWMTSRIPSIYKEFREKIRLVAALAIMFIMRLMDSVEKTAFIIPSIRILL